MSMAWRIPFSSAPTRTFTSISWRGDEAIWDSYRVKTIMAGLPVSQVTRAGYTSEIALCLAPKPPPIRGLITRTLDLGMFKALATIRRQWNTTWVELVTTRRP